MAERSATERALDPTGNPRAHSVLGARHPRWVGVCWALLMVNVLQYIVFGPVLFAIPRPLAQLLTMGCLILAFAIALVHNPRFEIRPNALLTLLTVLLFLGFASSLRFESGAGALVRSGRGAVFLCVLWLLTPYWRSGLQFAVHHLRVLCGVAASVLVGLVLFPGLAMSGPEGGRLQGIFWPITPTHVAQYSAVILGLTITLWLSGGIRTPHALMIAAPALVLLVLSHSRTATLAFTTGVVLAGTSQFFVNRRARRSLAWLVGIGGSALLLFGPFLLQWYRRGETPEELKALTGRQKVWTELLDHPRSLSEHWLGIGFSDKSFGGRPIDSTWLSAYHEMGLAGLAVVVCIYVSMLLAVAVRPPSPERTCATFLVVYAAIASYTEVGIGDTNSFTLHLALAAAMLHGADAKEERPRNLSRCTSDRPDGSTS